MELRTAITTSLDTVYELKAEEITVELPDGSVATGRVTRDSAERIARLFVHRLARADEYERNKSDRESKKARLQIKREFKL